MDTTETLACWSNHLGLWCIEPGFFTKAVELYKAGLYPPNPITAEYTTVEAATSRERREYDVIDHVAILNLHGPMSKGGSWKFRETSTVRLRQLLRDAMKDEEVKSVLFHIDSPGGHVAGTSELAQDVARLGQSKPIFAHIEDLGASAAYWVASQAQHITANTMAEVGSIGTVAVLEDTSKRMERLGIEVHVISTGPYKGVGAEGAPISAEALSYFRGRVESLNSHFLEAVQRGRTMTDAELNVVSDGRVHIASMAQSYKLIDKIQTFDEALEEAKYGVMRPTAPLPSTAPSRHGYRQQLARHGQQLALRSQV